MKTYLVDTDVLIDFFKRRAEAVQVITQVGQAGRSSISVVSVMELLAGWQPQEASIYLPKLYAIFATIPVTQDIAECAGEYRQAFRREGKPLATIDTLIAATARLHQACLVTRNSKDYPMPDIELYPTIYY